MHLKTVTENTHIVYHLELLFMRLSVLGLECGEWFTHVDLCHFMEVVASRKLCSSVLILLSFVQSPSGILSLFMCLNMFGNLFWSVTALILFLNHDASVDDCEESLNMKVEKNKQCKKSCINFQFSIRVSCTSLFYFIWIKTFQTTQTISEL